MEPNSVPQSTMQRIIDDINAMIDKEIQYARDATIRAESDAARFHSGVVNGLRDAKYTIHRITYPYCILDHNSINH